MKKIQPANLSDSEKKIHEGKSKKSFMELTSSKLTDIKIPLASISDQQRYIFKVSTEASLDILKKNLKAPVIPGQTEIDESRYPRTHLLREHEGWEPPHEDIIGAYFRHFQQHFPDYGTDAKLAALLGLTSDRRVREYKSGDRTIPYGVWRHFLVLTGRAPQEIIEVKAFMG